MTSADLALYLGRFVAAWTVGFTAGYILTRFRDALGKVS